jgi:hypothetical protein
MSIVIARGDKGINEQACLQRTGLLRMASSGMLRRVDLVRTDI